jgi:DNA (cytosine-5)-methyltransferase 1
MDLGLERAGFQVRWQVEIDEFCRKVLSKHWPNVPKFNDVREVGKHNLEPVDLIAGGFPCQDISFAGDGAGLEGERSGLWRDMFRIVCDLRPRYVLIENVAALLNRGCGRVLADLASVGFDAEWSVVSACSLGAPHMRRRLFIVAHANRVNGWSRLWDSNARPSRPLQAFSGFEDSRTGWQMRLANPSELYGGANGIPFGLQRNRAIGNAVVPQVAEWIGKRIMESR